MEKTGFVESLAKEALESSLQIKIENGPLVGELRSPVS
jgi:hypothetical protein